MNASRPPNRLIHESSPYLLQHAHNPVQWHPWGDDAFARARTEEKPVFLSIGYSTCHWCHVMERESFENDDVAALLNAHFVPVKVDREERPDVDRVYMTALQAMGQNGGWPLSMFLTPDLLPFYGGTYFPPESRYGRIGFADLLQRIRELWEKERAKIFETAGGITTFLREAAGAGESPDRPTVQVLQRCYEQLAETFDPVFGGFGGGPKFPRPASLEFLLRHHRHSGVPAAREMVETTLTHMAAGGVYDHLAGGFHRYAVDGEWRVPHFEKMLYDQAQLVRVFADAFRLTGHPSFAAVARDTADYVLREMTSPEGVFFSAEDADSPIPESPAESGEGAFYVWTHAELQRLLGSQAFDVMAFLFGVEEGGNVPVDPHHEFTGRNILYRAHAIDVVARRFALSPERVVEIVGDARTLLRSVRGSRPRPFRDDKVLTAWNGLMIGALARASAALERSDYREAAVRAADLLLAHRGADGTLRRRIRPGEAAVEGQLEDYVFLVQGALDLYEAGGGVRFLEAALSLQETQSRLFADAERGGFFETSGTDRTVIARMKEAYDGAEPAGNSVAADSLFRLSRLLGRPAFEEEGWRVLSGFGRHLERQPVALPWMTGALTAAIAVPTEVFLLGPPGDPRTAALAREVDRRFLPFAVVHKVEPGGMQERLGLLVPFVHTLTMTGGVPTAFVCSNFACRLPTTSPGELGKALDESVLPPP